MALDKDTKNLYFATKPSREKADIILKKAGNWYDTMRSNGYLDKLRATWAAYHGAQYGSFGDSHQIQFSGEQGELTNIAVNHMRNIAEHMINMITAVRPAMECRSVNTDYKSLIQAKLGNSLLDYYMREKRLEKYLETAVVYAIVLGSGYIKLSWNSAVGELYDLEDEIQPEGSDPLASPLLDVDRIEIREGDLEFSNLSPFDVYFDGSREDDDHDWVVCRSWKNRFDLIAKYPEYKEEILKLLGKDEYDTFSWNSSMRDESSLVAVYEFYHRKSEACPEGNYCEFLSENAVLSDGPLPYRNIPIYKVVPATILGTPYGYSPLFDLLPIQDAMNMLYSTILSNQNALGLQNILSPRGADIEFNELGSGLNIIEYNSGFDTPKALQLLNTPQEIFAYLDRLQADMETISGINSVTRGNPEASLRSGNALALVQSMAIQFISRLQRSYVAMIEDVGTGVINIVKDFATTPRIKTLVGKDNRSYVKEFSGEDLSGIQRVIVDVANPLAKTTAGKMEIAQNLLQMGAIKNAQDFMSVMNTGTLELFTDDEQRQLLLARAENEYLAEGKSVEALFTDDHANHIKEHATVLADPELRRDPLLVKTVQDHIQQHINLAKNTDPAVLILLAQQPIQQGPPPPAQAGPPPMPPGEEAMNSTAEQIGQLDGALPAPAASPAGPIDPAQNFPV